MIDNKHNFHGKHVLALLIVLLLAPLRALNADETAVSHAQPLCTKFATVYQWDNRQLISDAPALMKLPDGTLLCSVQLWSRDDAIVQERYGRNRCLIFASVDEGSTWQERSRIPFNTGKFLLHNGLLYFIGSGIKWQGLHITSSSDRGKTWSNPVQLRNGKVYAASTGWVCSDNTLYWAADDMNRSVKDRAVFAFHCDLSRDPLDTASWQFSNDERHPGLPQSLGKGRHNGGKWLEPNVVDLDGKLLVIVRVRASQGVVDGVVPNMAAICSLEETENDELTLEFSHYYPFPGAQNQFHIIKDEERELFWMTSNQVTGKATDSYRGWGKERRFLMLHYSRDAQNWFPAGVLAMWRKETQAFNYCTPLIDGNDLLFVSRTSHNAANQHDNDCITFHRLENFRKTAVDLLPVCRGQVKPDENRPIFGEIYPGDATSLSNPSTDIAYRWIRQANLKLIEPHKQADGSGPWGGHLQTTALFDVKADPFEKHDLSSLAEHKQDVARLRTQLDRWWKPNELEISDLETRVVAKADGRWFGRATVERTVNGTLVLCYRGASRHTGSDGVIHVRFSNDGGQNWSDADRAIDGSPIAGFPISFDGDDAFEPYLYVAPNGKVILHVWRTTGPNHREGKGTWQTDSADGGQTWSQLRQVDFVGIENDDHCYATDDHTTIDGKIYTSLREYVGGKQRWRCRFIQSPDNGASWRVASEQVNVPEHNSVEKGFEYVGGDRIVSVGSDGPGRRFVLQTHSEDRGKTWQRWKDALPQCGRSVL